MSIEVNICVRRCRRLHMAEPWPTLLVNYFWVTYFKVYKYIREQFHLLFLCALLRSSSFFSRFFRAFISPFCRYSMFLCVLCFIQQFFFLLLSLLYSVSQDYGDDVVVCFIIPSLVALCDFLLTTFHVNNSSGLVSASFLTILAYKFAQHMKLYRM